MQTTMIIKKWRVKTELKIITAFKDLLSSAKTSYRFVLNQHEADLRITERLRLEGTSEDLLIQPPAEQSHLEQWELAV